MAIVNAEELAENSEIRSDVCIVGGGAAGITLAQQFEGSGIDVCLIESGGFRPDPQTQALYDLETIGYPMREDFISRARVFGGSCNLWAGRNMRMSPIDFEHRDWVPDSGWPIGYSELEPYYALAEKVLRIPAHERFATVDDISDIGACERDLLTAGDLEPTVALWGTKPMRFAKVNRGWLRRSRNVSVFLRANATEIVTGESSSEVQHVVVQTLGGRRMRARARIVVLACGGLESTRLLLASRRHQACGVGNEHGLVGRYFMEHPRALYGRIRVREGVGLPYLTGVALAEGKVQLGLALTQAAQREAGVLNGYVSLEPAMSELAARQYGRSMSVAKMIVRRGYDRSAAAAQVNSANIRELIYQLTPKEIMPHWLYRPYAWLKRRARRSLRISHLTLINFCEQAPNHASRVSLGAERDALGMHKLVLDWRVGEAERRTVLHLHERIGRAVERAGIGCMEESVDDPMQMHFTDASHHMGTTRMSSEPRTGVVNRDCRVHGLSNLYIASSSVFPTSGHANPTLTIIALTLRLADHLKKSGTIGNQGAAR